MKTLIIIGTGSQAAQDVAKLREADKKAKRCGINKAVVKRKCDIWYTAHPRLFALKAKGTPVKKSISGGDPNTRSGHIPMSYAKGSSALQAVYLALNKWGYDRVVLCGVPLTGANNEGLKYGRFVEAWENVLPEIKGKVFSMSGNTKKLLGGPYATRV